MTTLQVEETAAFPSLSSSPTRFKLDIFSEDQWTHSLELPTGKCTIGSSLSCQVRLTEVQVRPLHCLLVQEADRVTATSWAPGMLLNDQEFSSAPLHVGDKLSIGNLHLELAIADPVASDSGQDEKDTFDMQPDADQTQKHSPYPQPCQTEEPKRKYEVSDTIVLVPDKKSRHTEKKITESNQQARKRCRKLIVSLRQQRALAESSQQEATSHADRLEAVEQERDGLAAELEQLRSSSIDENRRQTKQFQALQGERDWLSGEVDQLRTNGIEEVRHLSAQLQAVESDRELLAEELEQQQTNSAQQIHHLSEQLQVGQAERNSLSSELEQLRQSSTKSDSQHDAELDRVIGELSAAYDKTTQAEAALSEAEVRNQDTQRRIKEVTAEYEQLTGSLHSLEEEKNRFAQKIAERDRQVSELEQGMRASQEAAQAAENKLAEQIHGQEELSSELAGLRTELSEAKSENGRLQETSEDLQRTISDHQQLLQCAREELRVATERPEQQSGVQEALRKELEELRTEQESYSEEKEKLLKEATEQLKRNELLEIDVKSLTTEWQQALAEITRLKKAEEESQLRIEELEDEQANFDTGAYEALASERDHLADQLRLLQEDIDAREDLLQNASQRLEQLHAIVSESEETHAELNEDIAARIGQIELLAGELEELRANVVRHEAERNQFTEKLTDRENTMEQLHAEFDALRTSISQVEQERDEIAQRFTSQESQLVELTAELEAKRLELEKFELEREQHATGLSDHESRVEHLNKELDTLRTSQSETKQERDQLVERLASQESQYAELNTELETMRSKDTQIDQEHEEYVQCIAAQVDQIEELTSQLELVRKNFSLVEQERDHVAKSIAERDTKIEQLTADLEQSRELLAECSEQAQQINLVYKQTLADLEQTRAESTANSAEVVNSLTIKLTNEGEPAPECSEKDATGYVESPTVALTAPIETEEEPPTKPSADFQPPSFIDQYSHLLDEKGLDQAEESLPSTSAPSIPTAETVQPSSPLVGGDDDDGDLEAYMSNLLRRVRGDVTGDSTASSVASENQESQISDADMASLSVKGEESAAGSATEPHNLLEIADLKATSNKPAQPIDLASMRELANSSARSAIAKHRKRSHFEGALGKILVTSLAGGTAGCMIAGADHYAHPLFLGGCAVGVVSIYWGMKLLGELLEMIRDGGAGNSVAEISVNSDSLPIDGETEILEGSQP